MKNFRIFSAAQRRQRGISLIEVLITLIVVAIGLLGIASLQTISLRTAQVSYQRTQAVNLAYEIMDVARANWFAIQETGLASSRLKPDQNCGGTLADCWTERANALLPNAAVEIDNAGGPNSTSITVTITWSDTRLEDMEGVELRESVTSRI